MSGRIVLGLAAAAASWMLGSAAAPAADINVIYGSRVSPCGGYPCETVQSGVRVVYGVRYDAPVYVPVPVPQPYYLVNQGPSYEPAIDDYPDVIYSYPYLPPFGYYGYRPYNPYGRYGYRPFGYPGYRPFGHEQYGYAMPPRSRGRLAR